MQQSIKILIFAILAVQPLSVSSVSGETGSRIAALNHIVKSLDKGIETFDLLAKKIEELHKDTSDKIAHEIDEEDLIELKSDILRVVVNKRSLIGKINQYRQRKTETGKSWTNDITRINGQVLILLSELVGQDSKFNVDSAKGYQKLLNSLYSNSRQLNLLSNTKSGELSAKERQILVGITKKLTEEIKQMEKVSAALGKYGKAG